MRTNTTRIATAIALIASLQTLQAQTPAWTRDSQDPKATEVWEPVPAKVTTTTYGVAPSDAIVLFDGKDLSQWQGEAGGDAKWEVKDGVMTVAKGGGIKTKQSFGSCQIHIEWRSPAVVESEGQGRGNSGIFIMGQYELQVLDSYESRTYSNGQAGSFYKQHAPLVNATKKPGEWQTYDIIFNAPVFDEKGKLQRPATATVFHNGVLVQNNVTLLGGTQYKGLPVYVAHGKMPLGLQDHGNPVSYRNIWIREL
ncbi:MAG: DUF1080 domain-containing protein [Bacteroidetes bacterium]|nr:MAG: DUF1080 domain-containing protein [Bacteroidota bacterium]